MKWVTSKRHVTAGQRPALAVQTLQADARTARLPVVDWTDAPRRFKWTRPGGGLSSFIKPLNAELNLICYVLVLLGDLTFMGPCIVSIFQYISNKMQRYTVYLYLETALHVSGCISIHHQERIQLYLQHLVLVTPLLLSAAVSWIRFECAVGGLRHPQHTQTGSNSSTITADSSNGVTNTRCCRYRCMRSWWWVQVPPETCRAVSRYK
jgi:hypothetical protein